jgi:thymidylate kinase
VSEEAVGRRPGRVPVSAAEQLVRRAYSALDDAGVTWCALHGGDELLHPAHDVDLLVAAGDRPRLEEALTGAGFLAVASFSTGGHVLFSGHEAGGGVLVDAVTELSYGSLGSPAVNWLRPRLETGAATACLERRVRDAEAGAWVLAPDDEFWTLVLNCVVDKRKVAERHARRLLELAPSARADGALARSVDRACPPGWSAADVVEAVLDGRWDELVALGPSLAERSTRRHPVANRAKWFAVGVTRLGRNVRARLRAGPAISVALLGTDGSGKSTLCARIPQASALPCRVLYMGLWKQQPRGLVHQIGQVAFRPLRMWRAYLTGLLWRLQGTVVVFDRYAYDALVPPAPPFVKAKQLYFSSLAALCPDSDVAVLLDAPAEAVLARRPGEDTLERLEAARRGYLSLTSKIPNLEVVDAGRDADAVLADVLQRVWRAQVEATGGRRPPVHR